MTHSIDPDAGRARLDRLDAEAEKGGGEARIQKQHEAGKLSARERIALLLDAGSFVEVDKFKTHRCTEFGMADQQVLGDGVVTGYGTVDGRQVFVFAQDFTVFGGSLSGAFAEKICKVMDLALEVGAPVVGLYDSGGARIQEGVVALAGYAEIFLRNTLASGVVPQVSLILGPCAGGAVYSPAITDFVFMVRETSYLFTNGPDVIREVTGEVVSREDLGGARVHASRSGVAHFVHDSEEGAIRAARELLSLLPASNREDPPARPSADERGRRDEVLRTIVPAAPDAPYDMREVVRAVVDDRRLLEVGEEFAPNLLVGFARLAGRPVGIVANQPAEQGGVIDGDGATKAARFVRFCDAFNVPLVTFVDAPGFKPGTAQEWGGLAKHGAKLLYAFAAATVPKVTVITRRAYGAAYAVMASKHLRADVNLAWTSAEIAVMSPEGAVGIVARRELEAAKDPVVERARLAQHYRDEFANPYRAAALGYVDEVIRAEDTRPKVISALEMLRTKRGTIPPRKHGNLPL